MQEMRPVFFVYRRCEDLPSQYSAAADAAASAAKTAISFFMEKTPFRL